MGVSSVSVAHKRGQEGPTVVSQSCWDGNRRLPPSTTSASRCCFPEVSDIGVLPNCGRAAFRSVFDIHLYVVPRQNDDKLWLTKDTLLRRDPDREKTAHTVRAALEKVDATE
jgi:hypothetical protein